MDNQKQSGGVAIPLSKQQKFLTVLGACALMMFLTASVSSLLILQPSLLAKLHATRSLSIATIVSTLGTAILTPIGGKMGERFGLKNVMVVPGVLALIALVGTALAPNFILFIVFRLLLSAFTGAYVAGPYVLMRLIGTKKETPKYMGYIATAMALGAFVGPFFSGLVHDAGYLELGALVPGVALLIALPALWFGFPNQEGNSEVTFDIGGMLLFAVSMTTFVIVANYAPIVGWGQPWIIFTVIAFFAALIGLIVYEQRVERQGKLPIIPVRLFENVEYAALLVVGLCSYFYQTPMIAYSTQALQDVLGITSTTVTGLLTLPRTVVSLFLPTLIGVWIAKKDSNMWKAICLSSALVVVTFIPLSSVNPNMPVAFFFIGFGITGIAESFRGVSITPAAQDVLEPQDLAVGTALVNTFNTLSSVLATSTTGFVYNAALPDVQRGVQLVFLLIVVVSLIGAVVAATIIRKHQLARAEA